MGFNPWVIEINTIRFWRYCCLFFSNNTDKIKPSMLKMLPINVFEFGLKILDIEA